MTYALKPDPATAALLRKIAESNPPAYSDVSVAQARQMSIDSGKALDAQPQEVARTFDMTVPGPARAIAIRGYVPAGAGDEPVATLAYFHGGGFVIGDLDTHDIICRALCNQAGVQVIAVDYRLAPEHRFPAAVEDALAAYKWLASPASEAIAVDRTRLAVGGDSAGGTLSAVITQQARADGVSLRAQLLLYPLVDMAMCYPSYAEFDRMPPIPADVLDWFWTHYFGGAVSPDIVTNTWASPMRAESLSGLPPAFVLTAGQDPLRDEGLAYASRLSNAGVETQYMCCMGTVHAFLRMAGAIPAAGDAIDAAAAFLKRRMV